MKKIIILSSLVLVLSGCAFDGEYRYPCQDPAKWEAPECNPPLCEPSGTCTKDLIGEDTTP